MKRSNYYIFIITVASLLSFQLCEAQQQPVFTQYMFNGLVLNPAYTGSQETMALTASFRNQWTGVKGSPKTQVFSAHSPLKFSRSAAGFMVTHDVAGPISQSTINGTYAYRIPLSKKAKLSIGAQVGATFYKMGDVSIYTSDPSNPYYDPSFSSQSRVLPNLGLGAYYYNKRSYVGLSIPTLIDNKWYKQDPNSKQQRHYFFTAGHVFDLNRNLKLKPNVLIKYVEHGPIQYDLNANLLINKVLWLGVSYRMKDSVDGIIEWSFNKQFRFGYSYGIPINALAGTQSPTHEVVLNFRLKQNRNIVYSPRYF